MESIFKKLGNPGLYHLIICILLAITWWSVAVGNTGTVFWGAPPKFECNVNDTVHNEQVSKVVHENSIQSIQNLTIWNLTDIEQCGFNVTLSNGSESKSVHHIKCVSWKYFETTADTVITEWNLVCDDNSYKLALASSIYYTGVFVGGLIFGFVADRFGRKKTLILCLFAQAPISFAIAFMPNYIGFVIMRFILGIWLQGISTVAFVHCVEFFPQKFRGAVMVGFGLGWASGQMLTALLAYALPEWRHMQIASAFICVVSLSYIWWIPESPSWLMTRHRQEEIIDVFITRAAKFNRLNVTETITFCRQRLEALAHEQAVVCGNPKQSPSFLHMVKCAVLLRRLLICSFLWLISSMTYYVFLINIRNLYGSPHTNFAVSAALEIVINLIIILIMNRFGRKRPLIICWLLVSVFCLISGFLPKTTEDGVDISWIITASSLLGKMVVSAILCIIFVYTAELFPTFARAGCFALCGCGMRIGGSIAPQILYLKDVSSFHQLPQMLIAVVTILAAFGVVFLPPTIGKQMPTTIEDAVKLKPLEAEDCSDNILKTVTEEDSIDSEIAALKFSS